MMPQTASGTTRDKENKSFVESPLRGPDFTAREVFVSNSLDVNLDGVKWDEINVTFPSEIQELFTYILDSVTVQTVLVTYDSTQKKNIIKLEKTRF